MANDHYVSQVHLKRFCSPELVNRLHAIRKSDQKFFTPVAKDICRVEEGSSNSYLKEARAIEKFLKSVEPKYNSAVKALEAGKPDSECVFTIAGFAAYVASCSPTAMRLGSEPLRQTIESTGALMEAKGKLPPAPAALGSTSFTELVRSGKVKIDVDPKYAQAMGIASIYGRIALFGNFKWDILVNEHADSEFFTCDFPAVMERSSYPIIFNRIVPLTPHLAVRIRPDIRIDKAKADFSFKFFGWRKYAVSKQELIEINRLIVRCAEDEVYFRTNFPWIKSFVNKNRNYWLEPYTSRIPSENGYLLAHSHRIAQRNNE